MDVFFPLTADVVVLIKCHDMTHDGRARLLFPDGHISYDEEGLRKGAKLCIVQYRNGIPTSVDPESIATAEAMWRKTS